MNSSSAQLLAAALAALLIVLVGATIFVLLNQPAGPTPAPSPTEVAIASPSPSAFESESPSPSFASPSPTASGSLEPTSSPSAEASPTESPTPSSPSPSPSPTPAPTVSPTSPQREFRLVGLGLDSRLAETSIERIVTFDIDGQSLISARITDASAGGIRMCLWREAAFDERECVRGRNVRLQRAVTDTGSSQWHVSMIGTEQASPNVTLTIRFNANSPRVTLDNFRYVGTAFPEYNGFVADVTAAGNGELRVQASFDDGQDGEYPYRLLIERPPGGEAVFEESGGPTDAIDESVPANAGDAFRVDLHSTEEFSADGLLPVFVRATLRWP